VVVVVVGVVVVVVLVLVVVLGQGLREPLAVDLEREALVQPSGTSNSRTAGSRPS
jgi:hypothetical protein